MKHIFDVVGSLVIGATLLFGLGLLLRVTGSRCAARYRAQLIHAGVPTLQEVRFLLWRAIPVAFAEIYC